MLSPLGGSRETASGRTDFLITGGIHREGGPTLVRGRAEKSKHQKGINLTQGSWELLCSELLFFQEMESHFVRCLRLLCVGFCTWESCDGCASQWVPFMLHGG